MSDADSKQTNNGLGAMRARRDWRAPGRGDARPRRASGILFALGVLFLLCAGASAAFAWQVRSEPLEQPLVRAICDFVGCGENERGAEARAVTQLSLHNIALAENGGRLTLTGFIGNNADRDRAQPMLVIYLYDAHGGLVTRRAVRPPNYLRQVTRLPMAPGQTRAIKYSLDDPGVSTLRYALELKAA